MVTKVMHVRGSKVKGHTLLKRNPKGRLHHNLSLVFQRCLSLGKLEHFGIQAAFSVKRFVHDYCYSHDHL